MKQLTLTTLLSIFLVTINAQVAINDDGTAASSSAMLDIKATDKGILIPRLTQTQISSIGNPVQGLLVYNITHKYFEYYDNSSWNILKPAENVSFVIDADYDTKIQVEENSDEDKIRFDIAGTEYFVMSNGRFEISNTGQSVFLGEGAGSKDDLSSNQNVFIGYNTAFNTTTGYKNTAIGESSMYTNVSGYDNTALGYQSLYSQTAGHDNVALGAYSLKTTTGNENTSVGTASLFYNSSGAGNTALGNKALYANSSGSHNIAIGYKSAHNTTTSKSSIVIGQHAGYQNNRSYTVAVGDSALYKNGSGATQSFEGMYNTAVGSKTLFDNSLGYSNTGIGFRALTNNDNGWKNTAVGTSSMRNNNTGSRNTALGNEAMYFNGMGSYNTAVGHQALNSNDDNYNTALGAESMMGNSDGSLNSAGGYKSLFSNISGNENTAFGSNTLFYNIASNNTAFGSNSLYNNSEGSGNVAVGNLSLFTNQTGSNNTAIGYGADVLDNGFANATAIGYDTKVGMSDAVVIGNQDVKVGLAGVTAPTEKLEVPGAVKIGNTANASPSAGTIRWNDETSNFEGFDGSEWLSLNGVTSGWAYSNSSVYGDDEISYDTTGVWEYGYSIHSDNNFLVIGAPGADFETGKVFVYEKTAGDWMLHAVLTASDGTIGDRFGNSVSVNQHMLSPIGVDIIIGAPNANSGKGKAYIQRYWNSAWSETNILSPSDLTANAHFGSSVSTEYSNIAVGAKGYNNNSGKVYMYGIVNYNFVYHSSIIPGDIGTDDNFGHSLSLDDDFLIVGAPGDLGNSVTGKAYIYENQSSVWTQISKKTNNLVDGFGYSVSIIMDYDQNIVIGAPWADVDGNQRAGKAFVYELSGASWDLTGSLDSYNPAFGDNFGYSVSTIYSNNVMVGEPNKGSDNGVALLFEKTNGVWLLTTKFYPSSTAEEEMGNEVNMLSPSEAFSYSKNGNGKGKVNYFSTKPDY